MSAPDIERLQSIKTLPSLVAYLRDDLDWPIEADEIEDVFFEYDPEELGLAPDQVAGIKEIKQLRPMDAKQPWGIFWVNFEKKRLPVVMLRRILGHLVIKKRASANKAVQRAWHANDLLFISAYGEEHDRAITFAHFAQNADSASDLPVLKVLGWDGGDTVLHLADAHRTLTEKLRWPVNPDNLAAWRDQWTGVFTLRHREVISTTTELVEELAKLATSIRKRVDAILSRESDRGPMRRLYGAFKTALIHDLSEDDFADVIAQTISYGLLAARFSSEGGISIKSLVEMIPPTNPFLRELLAELLAVAGRKKGAFDFDELGIQDVVDLLNHANAEAVKSDFGNKTRNEDPVIHFYEHFLHAYDRQKRVQRGAFYTPTPVVSYIVRSVHDLLQTEFGLADGLADTSTWGDMVKRNKNLKIPDGAKAGDPFVLILDPATGTATFLVEVIEVIFTHLNKKWTDLGKTPAAISKLWNEYVPKNLLPRLYGYELMMAPYTIAHMKLGLKLQEINARLGQPGFQFTYTDRAHIYLTNSLEPAADNKQGALEGIFPALAHEAAAVNRVKQKKRFTVVIGNPPYSHRANLLRPEQRAIIEPYKLIDGRRMKVRGALQLERNLNDDYVKFVRFAQLAVERAAVGLCGMITNNAYLENLTFPGMRNSLASTFKTIRIVNLHGSAKACDTTPEGARDENVFDIQQGVAISLMSKPPSATAILRAYCDVWGLRTEKEALLRHGGQELTFVEFAPVPEMFLFVPAGGEANTEYDAWKRLDDIFRSYGTGIMTNRNGLTIGMTDSELTQKIALFVDQNHDDATVSERLEVKSNALWDLHSARAEIAQLRSADFFRPIDFRPFDERVIFYHSAAVDNMRRAVMDIACRKGNLTLVVSRQQFKQGFQHVLVTRQMFDECYLSAASREKASGFSLYGRPADSNGLGLGSDESNLRESFLPSLAEKSLVLAEAKFCYIYAIMHSHSYRTRYAEVLKRGYPRIPEAVLSALAKQLACLGSELVALHLMESPKLDKHITKWIGDKHPEVEKVTYSDETVWTDKAQREGFRGVSENVWSFHIGGYQVCEKWLKDRRGRTLSADDIAHYHKIVVALQETIRVMVEIDKVIESHGGWPGAFQAKEA